jgi:hypothetical protein
MKKNLNIIIGFVVLIVVCLATLDYLGYLSGVEKVVHKGDCSSFSMKTDAKSIENIEEIVTTLANTSTVGLAFKASHLRAVGKEIDNKVPSPFVFLAIIFSNPKLAKDMKIVQQSAYKYNNFCEGLDKNMMLSYQNKECFEKTVRGFSKQLKLNFEKTFTIVETCAEHGKNGHKNAFKPFVDYLIKQKS